MVSALGDHHGEKDDDAVTPGNDDNDTLVSRWHKDQPTNRVEEHESLTATASNRRRSFFARGLQGRAAKRSFRSPRKRMLATRTSLRAEQQPSALTTPKGCEDCPLPHAAMFFHSGISRRRARKSTRLPKPPRRCRGFTSNLCVHLCTTEKGSSLSLGYREPRRK
ncbi:hypothetical protein MTO96_007592 [Rhipicephalus appendiculatus]